MRYPMTLVLPAAGTALVAAPSVPDGKPGAAPETERAQRGMNEHHARYPGRMAIAEEWKAAKAAPDAFGKVLNRAGRRGMPMGKYSALLAATAVIAAAPAIQAQSAPAGVAGRWTQASSGKEMVLAPRIKLQPNVGVSQGTSLGGTTGYGSMTRTTIVTEPVLMDVARSMTLAIRADGRFEWTIVRRHAEKADCTITTTQVKQGRFAQGGDKAVFTIEDGSESFVSSCGRKGTSSLAKATERYDMQLAGGRLVLSSGPSRWAFTRG